jgi:hypothetical protein
MEAASQRQAAAAALMRTRHGAAGAALLLRLRAAPALGSPHAHHRRALLLLLQRALLLLQLLKALLLALLLRRPAQCHMAPASGRHQRARTTAPAAAAAAAAAALAGPGMHLGRAAPHLLALLRVLGPPDGLPLLPGRLQKGRVVPPRPSRPAHPRLLGELACGAGGAEVPVHHRRSAPLNQRAGYRWQQLQRGMGRGPGAAALPPGRPAARHPAYVARSQPPAATGQGQRRAPCQPPCPSSQAPRNPGSLRQWRGAQKPGKPSLWLLHVQVIMRARGALETSPSAASFLRGGRGEGGGGAEWGRQG